MRKLKYAVTFLLITVALARADDAWHFLIEPAFMRNEFSWPITGSTETVVVPGRMVGDEISPLHRANIARINLDPKAMLTESSKELARLKPEFVRDKNGVILYAKLTSDSPFTASAVLAPEFEQKFADTIGPDMLVAIPSRYQVYLFPRQTPTYQDLSEAVILEYKSSPYPVSMELFSFKNGRLFTVGRYQ